MPNVYLPLKVDPFRFADNGTRMYGTLPIKSMERLKGSLASDKGDVEITMNFGLDEQGLRFVRGHLKAGLELQCQRCMESFNYEIIDDFKLGIVKSEKQAEELPERYDPLVMQGVDLLISELVEDELIISLPIVPMHDNDECKNKFTEKAEAVSEKDNPFKVIELLRSDRTKK